MTADHAQRESFSPHLGVEFARYRNLKRFSVVLPMVSLVILGCGGGDDADRKGSVSAADLEKGEEFWKELDDGEKGELLDAYEQQRGMLSAGTATKTVVSRHGDPAEYIQQIDRYYGPGRGLGDLRTAFRVADSLILAKSLGVPIPASTLRRGAELSTD